MGAKNVKATTATTIIPVSLLTSTKLGNAMGASR